MHLLGPSLPSSDLSMTVLCECGRAGIGGGECLPMHPKGMGPSSLRALYCLCLGIKPPSLFSLLVQMPKLQAAGEFEFLETH